MSTTRTYPGMCDDSLEIFFHQETKSLKAIYQGKTINYRELPRKATAFLDGIINQEPETADFLQSQFPNNLDAQKEMLAKCRFGGLNFIADVQNDHQIKSDWINCEIRETCKGCGIVCNKLEYKGEELSEIEIKAIQLLSTSMKNEAVIDELHMHLGSFHVFKTNLYKRFGINTKQELTRVGVELGVN